MVNAALANSANCKRSCGLEYAFSGVAGGSARGRLREAGAAGARIVGGGFGGIVLGLFAPGVAPLAGAREVRLSAGAHLLEP